MPKDIRLNGQVFSHSQLLDINYKDSSFSDFESTFIQFYQQWFSDTSIFSFQTSGTTAAPKTIEFKREHLVSSAEATIKVLDLKSGMNTLLCLSPKFVAGKMMMVRAFIGEMHLEANEPSENPLEDIDNKIDFIAVTPNQLYSILNSLNTKEKFYQIQKVIVGGGTINNDLEALLKDCKNEVFHSYAMTETLTHIALIKINGQNPATVFTLLPGFKIKPDPRGCLMIKTPYHDEWIVTNDLIKMNSQYSFQWLGRIDNMINSGGIKIIPEEMESIIALHFNDQNINNRFFLYGIVDKKLGQKLALIVEGELELDEDLLIEKLKTLLPKYKSPKNVILIHQFEITETGKINRKKTIDKFFKK